RDRSAASASLGAGSYSYEAFVADNANYKGTNSGCEPFTVGKAQLRSEERRVGEECGDRRKQTGSLGTVRRDTVTITNGLVTWFSPAAITFQVYPNGSCTDGTGLGVGKECRGEGAPSRDRSAASASLGAGSYSYEAFVADNANYKGTNSGCEPFTVGKAQL